MSRVLSATARAGVSSAGSTDCRVSDQVLRRRLIGRLGIALALLSLAPAAAGATAPPRLGTWEGKGSRGIAISFRLVRSGHLVVVAGGMTVTLPTSPPICPAGPRGAAAVHYKRVSYGGPGAPPLSIFHFRPRQVRLDVNDLEQPFLAPFTGTLRNRRTMVLTWPAPSHQPKGCGWPRRRLRWVVHRATRVRVATGPWTGTLSAVGGITGTVQVHVSAAGRVVDDFEEQETCPGSGAGGGGMGTNRAQEFIDRHGRFAGPIGPSAQVNGVVTGWRGRFAGSTLTGTVTSANRCPENDGRPLVAAFVAHPGP
jgi:hypothetical protein